MKLRNTTDLPDDLVRQVISFVRPPGVRGFDVMLRNSLDCTFKGAAYFAGSRHHRISHTGTPFVTLYVSPRAALYPTRWVQPHRGGYLPIPPLANRLEALIYIAAHELRHLWQDRVPRGRRVWGSRGQFSERDCDAYAIRALRRWRREGPYNRSPRDQLGFPIVRLVPLGGILVYNEAVARRFRTARLSTALRDERRAWA